MKSLVRNCTVFLATLGLVVGMGTSFDTEAKRSSGSKSSYSSSSFKSKSSWSSSKSRSSSSSSSSWRSTKSSTPSYTKKKTSTWVAGSSTTKRTTVSKAKSQSINNTSKSTSLASQTQKKQRVAQSRNAYKAQQTKFKPRATASTSASKSYAPPKSKYVQTKTYASSPIVNKTVIINNRSTYYKRRGSYYDSWDSPSYAYSSYNSFGMWDSLALWYMLDHVSDQRQMELYYNHANSAGMQEWRREADKLARDNAELRAKLDAMDRQQLSIQAKGVPRNEKYIPEGIDADILLSSEVLASTKPDIRMCTGPMDMNYYNVAKIIGRSTESANIIPVETNGSAQNLEMLESGRCDGAIVQRDSYLNHVSTNPSSKLDFTRVMSPYAEIPHLVCNYESGITELTELTAKHTVFLGKKGSGSEVTWNNLIEEVPAYSKVKVEHIGGALAKSRIQTEPNSCLLTVSGKNTKFMRDINKIGGKIDLQIVDWDDRGIFDAVDPSGEQLYGEYSLPASTYNTIQMAYWHTLHVDTDVITIPADVILNNSWVAKNEKTFDMFATESGKSVSAIRQYVGRQQ